MDTGGYDPTARAELFREHPAPASCPGALSELGPEGVVWRWECPPITHQGPGPKLVWPCRQSVAHETGCQFSLRALLKNNFSEVFLVFESPKKGQKIEHRE